MMNRRLSFMALIAAAVIALPLLFGGAWATASAAQDALPGDTLFSVKTALEDAQVALAQNAADDARLHLDFAAKRLDEMARLAETGRYGDLTPAAEKFEFHVLAAIQSLGNVAAGDPAEVQALASAITEALSRNTQILSGLLAVVPSTSQPPLVQALKASQQSTGFGETEFVGTVESIGPDHWQIDGQSVIITTDTEIEGAIAVGDEVKIHASPNDDGSWVAREIERWSGGDGDNENGLNGNANDNDNDDGDDNMNGNDKDDDDDGNMNGNDNDDDDDDNMNGNDKDDDDDDNMNGNDNDDDDDDNMNGNDNDDDDDDNDNDD